MHSQGDVLKWNLVIGLHVGIGAPEAEDLGCSCLGLQGGNGIEACFVESLENDQEKGKLSVF